MEITSNQYWKITSDEYWQLYLNRINSVTLRKELKSGHTKSILDILSRFNSDFLTSLDVGPGWIHIIADLNKQISYIDPHYKIAQIKQQFGRLRYYVDPSFDKKDNLPYIIVRILIVNAENLASHTCEQCGKPGRLKITPPAYTLEGEPVLLPRHKVLCGNCAYS